MSTTEHLLQVFREHFSDQPIEELRAVADEFVFYRTVAGSLQQVERREKPPEADLVLIDGTIKDLRKAEDRIRKLGNYGGSLLKELAHLLDTFEEDAFAKYQPSATSAVKIFAEHLAMLRTELERAKAHSEQYATESNIETRGRPTETEANLVAGKCYDLFKEWAGQTPTISTARDSDKKYGPFLDFVTDVFSYFEIKVSPVNAAREACRERKPEN